MRLRGFYPVQWSLRLNTEAVSKMRCLATGHIETHDGGVLAFVVSALVGDLTDVMMVLEEGVEGAPGQVFARGSLDLLPVGLPDSRR